LFISFLFLWILFAYDPNLAFFAMDHKNLERLICYLSRLYITSGTWSLRNERRF